MFLNIREAYFDYKGNRYVVGEPIRVKGENMYEGLIGIICEKIDLGKAHYIGLVASMALRPEKHRTNGLSWAPAPTVRNLFTKL